MYDEEIYMKVLDKMSDFGKKKWLLKYFELYKLTLIWPPNLPPIGRSNLIKGTYREKFHSTYIKILSEFEHELDNEKQTLKLVNC